MNVSALIKSREKNWQQLEESIHKLRQIGGLGKMSAEEIAHFTALHRAVCADLALCRSYRLPPGTAKYLNDLVGRSHNQLYRDQSITFASWMRMLMFEAPYRILIDKTFWVAMFLFWGSFLFCAFYAANSPDFAEKIVGSTTLNTMEDMYSVSFGELEPSRRLSMVGFYIFNNASIGLVCFAFGILYMVPGLLYTLFNGIFLGTIFGHMYQSAYSDHFFEFVTAHGPFELTAIVLASGAGLRLGFSLIHTRGLTRGDSLRLASREATPIISVATLLFCFAAVIEAFISPSPMSMLQYIGLQPRVVKSAIAILCAFTLIFYIFGLGTLQYLRKREAVNPDGSHDLSTSPEM